MPAHHLVRSRRLCTFRIGPLRVGMPVEQVQEILRPQRITSVPLADPIVRGLINLRGRIVTAIDLRTRLALPPLEAGAHAMNVVVDHHGEAVTFLVDTVGDVVEATEDRFALPPPTLRGPAAEIIVGAYVLDDLLLLVLDLDCALTLSPAAGSPPAPPVPPERQTTRGTH
jgi:purine-binding chemotaxis protein CheW